MWPSDAWWFLAGWLLGWLLLARLVVGRRAALPAAAASRPAVAVVVPARDEAAALPHLLGPLLAQCRDGDEVVVVDDHSGDDTAAVAVAHGARVVPAPSLPDGWRGKPHACAVGAAATVAPLVVFLDADVRPGPDLLDQVAAAVDLHPDAVVSVQPFHHTERWWEQISVLPGIVALMSSGRFAAWLPRRTRPIAFGPVLAVRRTVYERSGGHGAPGVRGAVLEDVALGRAVGDTVVYAGGDVVAFRMYPGGWRDAVRGWTRTMGSGLTAAPWWAALGAVLWVTSLLGGPFATWVAYPLSAVQVLVLARRVGRFAWWVPLVYPLLAVVFAVLVVRALVLRLLGRGVLWKGRVVGG